jgi:hypothetical protein
VLKSGEKLRKLLILMATCYKTTPDPEGRGPKTELYTIAVLEEMVRWDKVQQQSTCHAMKFVVISIGIGLAVWLLDSQAAFSQTMVGYIATIATLLTTAGNLFGRSGAAKAAKADGE